MGLSRSTYYDAPSLPTDDTGRKRTCERAHLDAPWLRVCGLYNAHSNGRDHRRGKSSAKHGCFPPRFAGGSKQLQVRMNTVSRPFT